MVVPLFRQDCACAALKRGGTLLVGKMLRTDTGLADRIKQQIGPPRCAVGLVGRQDHALPLPSPGDLAGVLVQPGRMEKGGDQGKGRIWNVPIQATGSRCGFLRAGGAQRGKWVYQRRLGREGKALWQV